MYENDIVETDGSGGNLLANSIVAGVGLAIAGISYACGAMIGKNSAAKEAKRMMWVLEENKKRRIEIFGKEEYDYWAEYFADELKEAATNNRKSHANNSN